MKKNLIEKWKETIESVAGIIIYCILRNYSNTKKVQVKIIKEPLKNEEKMLQTIVSTYYHNKQNFRFYIVDAQDVTEIFIYEDNMSSKNYNKTITIEERQLMTSLNDNEIKSYSDSIVGFLLANIEWK